MKNGKLKTPVKFRFPYLYYDLTPLLNQLEKEYGEDTEKIKEEFNNARREYFRYYEQRGNRLD